MNVLVTGGAGFIGTNLTRRLLQEGCRVTILDNFSPQIHGNTPAFAPDLKDHVELYIGDVTNRALMSKLLCAQDVVVHLAAETGTGQSMYDVVKYEQANLGGTATLLDCLVNDSFRTVKKIVVASSRAIYGEGAYNCPSHGIVYPGQRTIENVKQGLFEPQCPICADECKPVATSENALLQPSSFYGLTKQMQEQMILLFAKTIGISAFALRYQNVYGPGQSLKNPYTGILAIFANLAQNNQLIQIFEDGLESRDFVYIDDVVEATWQAIHCQATAVESLNVGSGERITVLNVAQQIVTFLNSQSQIQVTGAFRQGDIRHNLADLAKIHRLLGYTPRWNFSDGIRQFLTWAVAQGDQHSAMHYERSLQEMRNRGLMHG